MTSDTTRRDVIENAQSAGKVPSAVVRPARRWSWVWLVPMLAIVMSAVLVVQSQRERGRSIRVRFDDGSGIQAGDPVMYRGVQAGRVRGVTFAADLNSVLVSIELRPDAENLAVDGSVFWVVRPEVSLTRVSGLETIVGPRYVQVKPGPASAALRAEFVGVDRPPTGLGAAGAEAAKVKGCGAVTIRARCMWRCGRRGWGRWRWGRRSFFGT